MYIPNFCATKLFDLEAKSTLGAIVSKWKVLSLFTGTLLVNKPLTLNDEWI